MLPFLQHLIDCMGYLNFFIYSMGLHVIVYAVVLLCTRPGSFIRHYFTGHLLCSRTTTDRFGQWALVTGCTDGIGKAYARAFAELNHNVILVSRNEAKLQELASELKQISGVETKVVVADFARGYEVYDEIKNAIKDTDVGILVNNVGTGFEVSYFHEIPEREKFIKDIINVNVSSCAFMTSLILPEMVKRGKGLILNISSMAATTPMPGLGLYCATKSFVDCLSKSLQIEYRKKGIVIQSVLPGQVSTKLSGEPPSLSAPTPEIYVKSQLKTINLGDETYGYYIHSFVAFALRTITSFPRFLRDAILFKLSKLKESEAKNKL